MARTTARRALQVTPEGPTQVEIPHLYAPRTYQRAVLAAMDAGCTRAVTVWHRRAGKDLTWLTITIKAMLQRPGTYFHVYPTYAQAKKAIWDGKDSRGIPFLARFPEALIVSKNETEMQIILRAGLDPDTGLERQSTWQLVGADKPDSVRGTNPVGVVFSEYPTMDDGQALWDIVRPILNENGGWAGFAYTPLGENHGWELYEAAKLSNERARADGRAPTWFVQLLTVKDTVRDAPAESGGPVVTEAMIEEDRLEGMPDELIDQEYYCAWTGAMQGSYYGQAINAAEAQERIGLYPYDSRFPVHTAWDIGRTDATAIWFYQQNGPAVRLIDFYENTGQGLMHYIHVLKEQRAYVYGQHLGPHDLEVAEWTSNKTRVDVARAHGLRFRIVAKLSVQEGIEAVRALFPRLYIDRQRCKEGITHLKGYRKEWDKKRRAYKDEPFHDVHSDAADALRYLAVGLRETKSAPVQASAVTTFNPMSYEEQVAETEFDVLRDFR
jgi:hypothetical protein